MSRSMLIAGNWKMNGLQASRGQARELVALLGGAAPGALDVLLCPPATLLADMARDLAGSGVFTGGQNCHAADHGAHTGDIAAPMIKDTGGAFVIVGHSERRADHGESSAMVRAKAEAALRAGLVAIICVGETEADREAGRAFEVVGAQVRDSLPPGAGPETCVLAYEPVWAIGTGQVASLDDIAAMHGRIRAWLVERGGPSLEPVRLLYGGSVKPGNAKEIFALEDVDGGLIGGASLKASDFAAIIEAALASCSP